MLKIRLSRIGKKKQPYYRLVVSENARDMYGRALEILGSYNPRNKQLEVKKDRVEYWLSKGAQASATIHNLLVGQKIIEGKKASITHIKNSKKTAPKQLKTEEKPKTEAVPEANKETSRVNSEIQEQKPAEKTE